MAVDYGALPSSTVSLLQQLPEADQKALIYAIAVLPQEQANTLLQKWTDVTARRAAAKQAVTKNEQLRAQLNQLQTQLGAQQQAESVAQNKLNQLVSTATYFTQNIGGKTYYYAYVPMSSASAWGMFGGTATLADLQKYVGQNYANLGFQPPSYVNGGNLAAASTASQASSIRNAAASRQTAGPNSTMAVQQLNAARDSRAQVLNQIQTTNNAIRAQEAGIQQTEQLATEALRVAQQALNSYDAYVTEAYAQREAGTEEHIARSLSVSAESTALINARDKGMEDLDAIRQRLTQMKQAGESDASWLTKYKGDAKYVERDITGDWVERKKFNFDVGDSGYSFTTRDIKSEADLQQTISGFTAAWGTKEFPKLAEFYTKNVQDTLVSGVKTLEQALNVRIGAIQGSYEQLIQQVTNTTEQLNSQVNALSDQFGSNLSQLSSMFISQIAQQSGTMSVDSLLSLVDSYSKQVDAQYNDYNTRLAPIMQVSSSLQQATSGTLEVLQRGANDIISYAGVMASGLQAQAASLGKLTQDALKSAVNTAVRPVATAAIDSYASYLTVSNSSWVSSTLSYAGEAVGGLIEGVFDALGELPGVGPIFDKIAEYSGNLTSGISNAANEVMTGLQNEVSDIFGDDVVSKLLESTVNTVLTGLEAGVQTGLTPLGGDQADEIGTGAGVGLAQTYQQAVANPLISAVLNYYTGGIWGAAVAGDNAITSGDTTDAARAAALMYAISGISGADIAKLTLDVDQAYQAGTAGDWGPLINLITSQVYGDAGKGRVAEALQNLSASGDLTGSTLVKLIQGLHEANMSDWDTTTFDEYVAKFTNPQTRDSALELARQRWAQTSGAIGDALDNRDDEAVLDLGESTQEQLAAQQAAIDARLRESLNALSPEQSNYEATVDWMASNQKFLSAVVDEDWEKAVQQLPSSLLQALTPDWLKTFFKSEDGTKWLQFNLPDIGLQLPDDWKWTGPLTGGTGGLPNLPNLPDFELPDFEMPDVELPDLSNLPQLPDIGTPTLPTLPELPDLQLPDTPTAVVPIETPQLPPLDIDLDLWDTPAPTQPIEPPSNQSTTTDTNSRDELDMTRAGIKGWNAWENLDSADNLPDNIKQARDRYEDITGGDASSVLSGDSYDADLQGILRQAGKRGLLQSGNLAESLSLFNEDLISKALQDLESTGWGDPYWWDTAVAERQQQAYNQLINAGSKFLGAAL